MKIPPTQFEGHDIRRVHDEATDTWWFSVVDVMQVLTEQPDDLTARKYWNQLKRRLNAEGSELVTACHQLKLPAADGKRRLTDVATAQTLLRLVQSVPSPRPSPSSCGWPRWATNACRRWATRRCRWTARARPGSSMAAATSGSSSA